MRNALIAIMFLLSVSTASGAGRADTARDHDLARDAVEAGERLPLSTILARIERSHAGRVLEIERERENGREIYEIELLREDGRVVELAVDATTGDVLGSEYED